MFKLDLLFTGPSIFLFSQRILLHKFPVKPFPCDLQTAFRSPSIYSSTVRSMITSSLPGKTRIFERFYTPIVDNKPNGIQDENWVNCNLEKRGATRRILQRDMKRLMALNLIRLKGCCNTIQLRVGNMRLRNIATSIATLGLFRGRI